jgi:hypothetical protein
MRRPTEPALVSLDAAADTPERWASFGPEDTALSVTEPAGESGCRTGRATPPGHSGLPGTARGDVR